MNKGKSSTTNAFAKKRNVNEMHAIRKYANKKYAKFEGKYAVKDITGHVRIIHRL